MCGIFGWIGAAPRDVYPVVDSISELLHHRGPDDKGYESGAGWGFGFRRLSILDLSPLGHQPMHSPDGRFVLVFNGEIYNYVELREALERAGEEFRSGSDTEVLLRLLMYHGPDALQKLNGMFALAFIDTHERKFLIARDRLGVKPLYYHTPPGSLRFGSELKALLAWPDAPRELDPTAALEYFALDYLPNNRSIFKGYRKVPPGHFIYGSLDHPDQAQPTCYWRLSLNPDGGDSTLSEPQLEELSDLLANATQIRLRSDVPVGIFLSGGIDSGLTAALAARSLADAPPLALTVGFSDRQFDETALARATAERTGLEHRVIMMRPSSLGDVDRLAWFYDEPFADASALPTFALCEAASEHATVFISGDGGDEAFGGYERYITAERHQWLTGLPSFATHAIAGLTHLLPMLSRARFRILRSSLPDAGFAATFHSHPDDPALHTVLGPRLRPLASDAGASLWQAWQRSRGQSLLTRQQALDYALYLPDDVLVKMDRASMAHSIEVRSPFLDYRVVEWAARLPRATLVNTRVGKLPLRALAQRLLPQDVEGGAKRGFGVPLKSWFRAPDGQQFLRQRLFSDAAKQRELWDSAGVERLMRAHNVDGARDLSPLLWRLLMFDAWARNYLDTTDFLKGPPVVGATTHDQVV